MTEGRADVEIIGVQSDRYPSLYNAVKKSDLPFGPSTIADGIAVKHAGRLTREIVTRLVTDILLVAERDIEEAVLALLEVEKTVVEGAGAVSFAALLRNRERFAGKRVGVVLSARFAAGSGLSSAITMNPAGRSSSASMMGSRLSLPLPTGVYPSCVLPPL